MIKWSEFQCLCDEGIARGFTCSEAKYYHFCGGCSKWKLCHERTADTHPSLGWYRGAIRLNWVFRQFDVIAYSLEQAEMIIKKKVGFNKKFGEDDFVIEYIRRLNPDEALTHKCECRIWEDRKIRKELCF